jgi:CRP-like cAMP-binding protein
MIDKLLMKLRFRDPIGPAEEAALRDAVAEVRDLPGERTFIAAGQPLDRSTVLLDGLIGRYKDLSGGQRQITELHVSGDFVDLHSFTLKVLDHNLMTLTPCRIAEVPHAALERVTERFPHLTRVLWFCTNLDACIHREWELSLGRRSAIQRTAHLFCELHVRLGIVGLATDAGFALPITQAVLAECLGLTPVHVNRVLRELREARLVAFRAGTVELTDLPGLRRVAEFDPGYLYLDRLERTGPR